jgi:Arc/MetJ family transcription regulator
MCIVMCMKAAANKKRTNIVLDQALVAEAARLTGIHTRRALVHEGLRALIELKRRRPLTDLRGKVAFAPGYDHKAARAGERR